MITAQSTDGLTELIVRQISEDQIQELIDTAVNREGLEGHALHEALVVSGAGLGIDRMQLHAIRASQEQIGVISTAITQLNIELAASAGNDEMHAFVSKVREPLVAMVRDHIQTILVAAAAQAEERTGVDRSVFLQTMPPSEMPASELRAVGATVAFNVPNSFHGFTSMATEEYAAMGCKCLNCLSLHFAFTRLTSERAIANAYAKYGTLDDALIPFALAVLDYFRNTNSEFADAYGNIESVVDSRAQATANAFISNLLSASGPGHSAGTR